MFGQLGQLGTLGTLGASLRNAPLVKGADWDESADSYIDIGGASSVHNALRVCLVTPGNEGAGDVILNQLDYTHDINGDAVALDGSQGHVMFRVPKFYYGYDYEGDTHNWRVSMRRSAATPYLHPWFTKAGIEVPYRYYGVYEATGYDVSAGAYVDGDGTNSWFNTSEDKLGSIVGKKPLTNKTRAQFRAAAARVGTGWSLVDFWGYAALKLLYVTRYADLDSQSVLGAGNTQFSSFNFATCISATGKVLSVTAPGQSTAGGDSSDYCNLLGVENPFGDIWEFVDGWNILDGNNYVCSDPSLFADDTTSNYGLYGTTNPTASGYQNTLQANIGLLPASVGAGSTTKVTDYYRYASGWRIARSGGGANDGASAGLAYLLADKASSYAYSGVGGRLCF